MQSYEQEKINDSKYQNIKIDENIIKYKRKALYCQITKYIQDVNV